MLNVISVTDAFLENSLKFSEQLSQRVIVFPCSGYSQRSEWVTQRSNKDCFKFSNT